jgi:Icc-related predicted phosphoesterase
MIRVAAIGDVHFSEDSRGRLREHWSRVHESADVLILAGDLTVHGEPHQAEVLVDELAEVQVPVVAVLGNHEYHTDNEAEVRRMLERRGVTVLECERTTLEINGETLGIAGAKGFGGGFVGACGHAFGEPEMKAFMRHTERIARCFEDELARLEADHRIALLHYAPVEDTLVGERLEIYPFLGSYLLAEAVDAAGADLCIHGHAHVGREKGLTPRGVPVRNVALPVVRRAFAVYHMEKDGARAVASDAA